MKWMPLESVCGLNPASKIACASALHGNWYRNKRYFDVIDMHPGRARAPLAAIIMHMFTTVKKLMLPERMLYEWIYTLILDNNKMLLNIYTNSAVKNIHFVTCQCSREPLHGYVLEWSAQVCFFLIEKKSSFTLDETGLDGSIFSTQFHQLILGTLKRAGMLRGLFYYVVSHKFAVVVEIAQTTGGVGFIKANRAAQRQNVLIPGLQAGQWLVKSAVMSFLSLAAVQIQ